MIWWYEGKLGEIRDNRIDLRGFKILELNRDFNIFEKIVDEKFIKLIKERLKVFILNRIFKNL